MLKVAVQRETGADAVVIYPPFIYVVEGGLNGKDAEEGQTVELRAVPEYVRFGES